jgi:hypothetical protein
VDERVLNPNPVQACPSLNGICKRENVIAIIFSEINAA